MGDLGIRKAAQIQYGLESCPTPAELERIAEPWRPYRSLACLYLWRSLDNQPALMRQEARTLRRPGRWWSRPRAPGRRPGAVDLRERLQPAERGGHAISTRCSSIASASMSPSSAHAVTTCRSAAARSPGRQRDLAAGRRAGLLRELVDVVANTRASSPRRARASEVDHAPILALPVRPAREHRLHRGSARPSGADERAIRGAARVLDARSRSWALRPPRGRTSRSRRRRRRWGSRPRSPSPGSSR